MKLPALDLDERLGVEASLALLETIFASGPVGFAFLDRDLCYVRVSTRMAEINGASVEAHLGRSVQAILGPDHWPARQAVMEKALAGEATLDIALTAPSRTADPAPRHVISSYFPVRAKHEVVGVAAVVRDVTEQVQAERALRASEERFRRIVETTNEGVWIIDAESRTTYVNERMAQLLGYTVTEMIGLPMFDFMDSVGRAIAAQNVERRRQGITEQHDFKFCRKDGSDLWVLISTNPIYEAGVYGGALGMVTDITNRRREAERQRSFIRDVLLSVSDGRLRLCDTPEDLPSPLPPVGEVIPLLPEHGLHELRCCVKEAAGMALTELQRHDLATASSEAGANAIKHGGGIRSGQVRADAQTIQVWVSDQGGGIAAESLPKATLQRGYSTTGTLGHGFSMILALVSRMWLETGPAGTTVVLEQDVSPIEAEWQ